MEKQSKELGSILFLFILYILMEFCGSDLVSDSALSESAKVQRGEKEKVVGKIRFLICVQMVLDKNRLRDSHCKLASGMKLPHHPPSHKVFLEEEGMGMGKILGMVVFLFPSPILKCLPRF